MKNILLVFVGGGAGSVLRYLTSLVSVRFFTTGFPMGTLLVNLAGCFLIGILSGFFLNGTPDQQSTRLFLVTGFCGGFTTFSAFAGENFLMLQSNQPLAAFGYILLSVLAGVALVWLGFVISK